MVGRKWDVTLIGAALTLLLAGPGFSQDETTPVPVDQQSVVEFTASEYAPHEGEWAAETMATLPAEFSASGMVVRPAWYFQAEALALKPDISGAPTFAELVDRVWIEDADAPGTWNATDTVTQRLDVGDLGLAYRGGGRAIIGRTLGTHGAMEVSYFQVGNWDDIAAVHDAIPFVDAVDAGGNPTTTFPASLFSPFSDFGDPAIVGLDYNSMASIAYSSRLYNVEWNLRRWVYIDPGQTQLSVLIGWRYINLDETFSYRTVSAEPGPGDTTNDVAIEAANRMLGVQIGAMYKAHIQPNWWVDCEAKAAFFDNNAGQDTEYVHAGVVAYAGTHNGSRWEHISSSAFDLKLTLTAEVTPRLAVRGGYQALWLYHVALAPNNFNTDVGALVSGPALLNDSGNVVYHGPHLSVTCIW
ncbi:MAG: BBP7 family outer membrane beta-barrel protein [Candidatus Nealsonbacteria bacterium]|nr:BBP7 family outer membrane beta-barrel protein [Candidatus Nealsonbacteria bacterium]